MENTNENTHHLRSFESLLRSKGYTGQFEVQAKDNKNFHHLGSLKECLQTFLSLLGRNNVTRQEFSLKTDAEYRDADDYKECQFMGSFDTAKGFVIDRLFIESRLSYETLQFKLRNNQEIPGKNAVIGRFRRFNPREHQIKGELKSRCRR